MISPRRQLGWLARKCGYRNRSDLFTSAYLKSLNFDVKTIVDVGVQRGTKELYDAFSACQFVLVDPQREAEQLLRAKPMRYIFINKGLAASAGRLVLKEQNHGLTTFLERTPLTAAPTVAEYEVEVTTLDLLLDSLRLQRPIGLKVDTEGFELEVIRGLTKYWSEIAFVICEASIRRRFIGSYQISELVAHMLGHGFFLLNFLNPTERQPRYYDIIFVPQDSKLFE